MSKPSFPGSLPTEGCKGCNPFETCKNCEYLYENGGQCGGCHVFYLEEDTDFLTKEDDN